MLPALVVIIICTEIRLGECRRKKRKMQDTKGEEW